LLELYFINEFSKLGLSVFLVSDNAHARFDATARVYEYWLCQHKNPFLKDAAWLLYSNLDFDVMNVAAEFLLEVNDFKSFSKCD